MSERVRLYGGELHAGRRTDTHGFEVRARIPVDGIGPSPDPVTSPASDDRLPVVPDRGLRWRWLDPACAGVLLVALEIGVLTGEHRHGPLALNMLAVAAVALAAVWRRRSPLWFLLVVGALAAVMNAFLTTLDHSPLLAAYFLLVPAYTAAAWLARRQAVLALAFLLGSTAISELIAHHQPVDNLAGAAFTISAAWAAGRAIRARRSLTSELQRTSARLSGRARGPRAAGRRRRAFANRQRATRGRGAQRRGDGRPGRGRPQHARRRSGSELTSRWARSRTPGARRSRRCAASSESCDDGDDRAGREPQPGVAQVYSLIQRARERGQPVELQVDGEPGTLAAGVDLGLYRILEDALESARRHPAPSVAVTVRFRDEDLELRLTARCRGPNAWPTDAMRERIALCDGALEDEILDEDGWQLVARMPRSLQGALL